MKLDKALGDFLRDEGIFHEIFDVIRLVEQDGHYVCRTRPDGSCEVTSESCHSVWGRETRCANCVSQRAYAENRQHVKFECAGDNFFFVIARPVTIDGRRYALELVINVTHQFTQSTPSEGNFVMDLIGEIERISSRDAFSGLYNKKHFRTTLEAELASRRESGQPLYLAIWDVDNFKHVNDTYGHAAGDQLLLAISQALSTGVAAEDGLVARFGGDEFAVLFTGSSEEQCQAILGRIRADIMEREHQLPVGGELAPVRIGISYGLAEVSSAADADAAIHLADEQLYIKKRVVHKNDRHPR